MFLMVNNIHDTIVKRYKKRREKGETRKKKILNTVNSTPKGSFYFLKGQFFNLKGWIFITTIGVLLIWLKKYIYWVLYKCFNAVFHFYLFNLIILIIKRRILYDFFRYVACTWTSLIVYLLPSMLSGPFLYGLFGFLLAWIFQQNPCLF